MADDPWKQKYAKKLDHQSMYTDLPKADYERYFREGYNSSLFGSRNRPHSSASKEVKARYDGAEYRANLRSRGSDHTRGLPPPIWEGDNTTTRRAASVPDSFLAPAFYPAMAMPVAAPVPVAAAAAAPVPAAGLVRQPSQEDVQMAELLQDFYREGGGRPQTRVFIPQGQLALRRRGAEPLPTIPVDGLDFLNAAANPVEDGLENLVDAVMEDEEAQADAEEAAAAMMDLLQYSIPNPQGLKRGGVARDVGFNVGKHNGFRR
jgi:hypothetical protein